jgi:hypothetical protein
MSWLFATPATGGAPIHPVVAAQQAILRDVFVDPYDDTLEDDIQDRKGVFIEEESPQDAVTQIPMAAPTVAHVYTLRDAMDPEARLKAVDACFRKQWCLQ